MQPRGQRRQPLRLPHRIEMSHAGPGGMSQPMTACINGHDHPPKADRCHGPNYAPRSAGIRMTNLLFTGDGPS